MEKKIIIFICIFFINNTHNLISMDSNIAFETMEKFKEINKKQEEKFLKFTNKVISNFPTIQKDQLLNKLKNKLTLIQNTINQKEQDLILKIKNDLKINDDLWKNILTVTEIVQNHEEACQHLSISNIIHDNNILPISLDTFKKYLVKNGINPNRINIKKVENINQWIVESPIPTWSVSNNSIIFDNSVTPGRIEIPFDIFDSMNDIKAFSIIYSYAIKNKKTIFSNIIFKYVNNFNTTIEELIKNEAFANYRSNIIQFAHIKAAFTNQKYATLLHTLNNKTFITDNNVFTAAGMHLILSKIKKYWDSIKWLQKYNPTKTQLTLKKDPTKEPVTLKELKLWEKNNNYPICLPIRTGNSDSHNIFDILETHSLVKIFTGKQDKLAYHFFTALAKGDPIYEHINTNNNHFRLKILSSNEYDFNSLNTKYSEYFIQEAIDMANQYARRKGKDLIAIR